MRAAIAPCELHARGGLGEVFMARDEELGREVALETHALAGGRQSERARRFQFEAEITGRLDHPGVVPVYGLGHDASGRLYYAMRFIRGETLQQAVEQFHRAYPPGTNLGARAIAFQKLIRSFLAVCQTMGYAHSQHVIHRDLKPANIMLGYYGETLVVDWGLAKRLPESRRTRRRDARWGHGRRDHGRRPDDAWPDQGFAGLHEPRAGRRPHRSGSAPAATFTGWGPRSTRSWPASCPLPTWGSTNCSTT